ncbi:MAG: inositol monophosphatase [Acidobacteria bacterium]|nr:inositol monophosphatase [Acidobacteriota bacterium]
MAEHQELLTTAIDAARAGAAVIMAAHRSGARIPYAAKARNDFVTAVDRESEAAVVGVIAARHPDHAILAEESAATDGGGAIRWIIDPLDGTTNFIHGFPIFCVSIAAAVSRPGKPSGEDVVAGVVFDPLREELFTATKGGGAYLNGERLHVSGQRELSGCLLATGFPFRAQHLLAKYLRIFEDLHGATQGIRRPGSAALDLAYVACGRVDGFFEMCLSPWDMAAGSLLIVESGGASREFEGGDGYLATGNIVAGPPRILESLLAIIRRHYP